MSRRAPYSHRTPVRLLLLDQSPRGLGVVVRVAAPRAGCAGHVDPPNDGHLWVDIVEVVMAPSTPDALMLWQGFE
jgi:hypothetical protein